ncbi:MAG: signal recognition particle protein [Simkaniaceae bacterium]|nr:signal recognition particle protein [Simkaniaceae bacterium]MCF7852958.1 signal recognition particle protein [Simkaniaceae bacterium]
MFGALTEKLQSLAVSLRGQKKLTEENIGEAVRQVRLALLDADVNFSVVSHFIKQVKAKALGEDVVKSVTPGDQFIKVVHDELVSLMGGEEARLNLKSDLAVILLCGLQGSGKTTHCAKLANYLSGKEFLKKPLLVACDLQRPAAIEQLKTLGSQINVPVFTLEGENKPLKVAKKAIEYAKANGFDVVIVDSAGRLHIDEALMGELKDVKAFLDPHETLFVANAALGQDAVKTAKEFDEKIGITGTILTMLDGTSRAGAAISIREVTQKPLKFEGIGEKMGDLQLFNPISMADRILGMGDIINLVKKAKDHFDESEAERMQEKMKNASFSYNDYLKQMSAFKKMGSFKSLMTMLPGMNQLPADFDMSGKELDRMEAMILSMTEEEREGLVELEPSRRRRIAQGSGMTIDDVNKMVKGFKRVKQMFKQMPKLQKKMKKNPLMSKLFS